MDADFRKRLTQQLESFQLWSAGRDFGECRLIQYCGREFCGGISIDPREAGSQIEAAINEGFGVDWNECHGRLYLMIWEPEGLEWSWSDVFAEHDLPDLDRTA